MRSLSRYIKNLLLFFVISAIFIPAVFSHNPAEIVVVADVLNNKLNINIKHPVSNPRNHYIKRVEVIVDEKPAQVYKFFFQKGGYKEFNIDVPDLAGVKSIVLKAYSTRGGSLEKTITLLEENKENETNHISHGEMNKDKK